MSFQGVESVIHLLCDILDGNIVEHTRREL
jgi:hypothetical protein